MSIKAGRVLSFPEMQALVRDLEACESPRTCPHGRPTMVQIGVVQLEREFGRT
jgi:DNA mismatch repair protein MutL